MTEKTRLEQFPEDGWSRALAVVAHPDDLEYGTSGAIARWTGMGRWVGYLLVSKGEAGMDDVPPAEAGPIRVAEQIAAARIVGVDDVEFLDYPDGLIEQSVALRRDIAEAIRRHRPEVVITINHHSHWGPGALNMADHRNVGGAVLDAVRDAANRWLFTDIEFPPWSGVKWVAVAGSPHSTHAVDITDTMDAAIASLAAHRRYLDSLGEHPLAEPADFLPAMARQIGSGFDSPMATGFEVIPM